ncbi:hypothetical protein HUJ04_011857 [Dendroctonus ponderosae]|nr:hypothetical protein HUJ04_011857 [Dendroctonus ponderosae]
MFSVSQFWFSNMSSFTLLVTFSALLAAAFANHYGHAQLNAAADVEWPKERTTRYHLVKHKPSNRKSPLSGSDTSSNFLLEDRAHEHHAHTNSEELARAEYDIKDSIHHLENIHRRNIGSSSEHSGHASRYWPISHEEHKRASLHHLLNTHHRAAAAHRAGTLTAGHALELLEAHQRVAAAHGLEHLIHPHGNAHHTLHSAEAVGSRSAGKHYHAIHEHESSKMHHY